LNHFPVSWCLPELLAAGPVTKRPTSRELSMLLLVSRCEPMKVSGSLPRLEGRLSVITKSIHVRRAVADAHVAVHEPIDAPAFPSM